MNQDSPKRRAERLLELERLLRAQGLPLTVQRRIVLEAVLERTDHPSADRIHQDIRASHPEVSRATVFRTLEKLTELGVLRRVCHPGSSVRYDPKAERHHHLVCLRCAKMVDFSDPKLDALALPPKGVQGFQISDYSIQFRGLCDDCRTRESTPTRKRSGAAKTQGRRRRARGS